MYISLHNHFDNDLFDGYQTVEEGVSRAKELGMTSLAITSHGTLSYTIQFYKECLKQGIKPILGYEAYFCSDHTIKDRELTHHLVLLAKNDIGWLNLKKLDGFAYEKDSYYYYKPRIDWELLQKHSEGLICLSACMASILNTDNGLQLAQKFQQLFGEDFYLEIQSNTMPEQTEYNKRILQYAKETNIQLVVTTDAHYSTKESAAYHKKWVSCNGSKDEYYTVQDFYIQSYQEINQELLRQGVLYTQINEAIGNTAIIAEKCNVSLDVEGQHLPQYPVDNQRKLINALCRENIPKKNIPREQWSIYGERYKYEMDILEKAGYLNYLLITWDILKWCKERNILTGIGRGSVGGSLVCYLLDIHKINPIEHNLLFERFVNPYRVTMADIDNDCESAKRDEVIQYIKEKYGHVSKIRTFCYLQDAGALQRAGQTLQYEPSIVDGLSKQMTVLEDIEGHEQLVDLAKHFRNRLEKFGCHASAVLITPDEAYNYVAVEGQNVSVEGTDKKEWTRLATFDYHDLEEMGLLKLDMLGLATLDVIKGALELITEEIDIEHLPLDDSNVYTLYSEGTTTGIFQVESPGMRQFAKQMKVDRFEDIVALVALYRPGPLDSGMAQSYIDGKNGAEVKYLHLSLESILKDTFGVIVYQEQVMKISQVMAGYNVGEADALRKIIGRKELEKIAAAVQEFIQKSVANGYTQEVAEEIGRQIQACGRYIFNRSHAVEYAYTSFITAYLRYYYPKEYFCALLNVKLDAKQEKSLPIIEECKRIGIKVVTPDLSVGNRRWVIEGESLRIALSYIKGIGKNLSLDNIDTFSGIISSNSKGVTEALIKAGALDYLGNRRELLGQLQSLQDSLKREQQCQEKIAENKLGLANAKTEKEQKKYTRQLSQWRKKLKECKEKAIEISEDNYNEIAGEFEVLSFSFKSLPKVISGKLVRIYSKLDKNKHEMAWFTWSSIYGEISSTVFWEAWGQLKDHVKQGETYDFVNDSKGILQELKTPEKIFDFRRKYNGNRR